MKKVIYALVLMLLLSQSIASANEPQPGLDYWNKLKQEAIQTESGLQYKVQIMGDGPKPTAKNKVRVHYRGILLNGVEFDSSWDSDEPVKFSLKKVIKGWTEGIQLMPAGSVFVFLIPPELAYGTRGSPPIPPNATLIFQVELFGTR